MKRSCAVAVLGGLLSLALPALPAGACSPAIPTFDVSAERVAAGGELRVSGDDVIRKDGRNGCDPMPPPTLSPTPEPTVGVTSEPVSPSESPSPSTTPLVTLPPLVHVAYDAEPQPVGVRISIAPWDDEGGNGSPWDVSGKEIEGREIAALVHRYEETAEDYRFTFDGSVRVPADITPGKYVLKAVSAVRRIIVIAGRPATVHPNYGYAWITVVDPLAVSGASDTLTRLALLVLLTGAGAVVLNRRLAR